MKKVDTELIERVLEKQCYIIDFLPMQVPKEAPGTFDEVENYILNSEGHCGLKDKYIRIILKVMCYYSIYVQKDKLIEEATPEMIEELVNGIMVNRSKWVNLLIQDKSVLIQVDGDCLHLSVYNPDEEICMLFEKIAISEGLFWRRSEEKSKKHRPINKRKSYDISIYISALLICIGIVNICLLPLWAKLYQTYIFQNEHTAFSDANEYIFHYPLVGLLVLSVILVFFGMGWIYFFQKKVRIK